MRTDVLFVLFVLFFLNYAAKDSVWKKNLKGLKICFFKRKKKKGNKQALKALITLGQKSECKEKLDSGR